MHVEQIARYPVKGLSAEPLDHADLAPGQAIAWDRAFALAQGDSGFDPEHPTWLPKQNFLCLMRNAAAARLQSRFDPATGMLAIAAPDGEVVLADALDPAGRAQVAAFLARFLGTEARGEPAFHHIEGHVFGDQRHPVVSLLGLASLAAYQAELGAVRDVRRFRANILLAGGAPWEEFGWVGRELALGTARLRVTKRTVRCPATQVNPDTAERDADPVVELRAAYGHADLGVHAEVIAAGRVAPGDAVRVLD